MTSGDELSDLAKTLPLWNVVVGRLVRSIEAPSFPEAIAYVVSIADAAEDVGHHPDIDIRWRTLRISLVTHDLGDRIGPLDVELARRIDAMVGKAGPSGTTSRG